MELRQPDHQSGNCTPADEVPWNDEAGDNLNNPYDRLRGHETRPLVRC